MPRLLVMARARVAEEDRAAYLDALAELAGRLGAHRHLWLFERRGHRGEFLEFREGPDAPGHPGLAPGDPGSAAIEARLARLASYQVAGGEPWEEVTLREPGEG